MVKPVYHWQAKRLVQQGPVLELRQLRFSFLELFHRGQPDTGIMTFFGTLRDTLTLVCRTLPLHIHEAHV